MTTNVAIIAAALLGAAAFKAGKICAPCRDGKLLEIIGGMDDKKMGASIPVLAAWQDAFTAAQEAR